MLAEDTAFLIRIQNNNSQASWSPPNSHKCDIKRARWHLHIQWDSWQRRIPEFKETKSLIIDSKHAGFFIYEGDTNPIYQAWKSLFFSPYSKVVCNKKHSENSPEGKQSNQFLFCQDVQKLKKSMDNCFPTTPSYDDNVFWLWDQRTVWHLV